MDEQTCPSCGRSEGVPLLWDMVDEDVDPDILEELWEAARRGELALGGPVIEPDQNGIVPDYECIECGHRWRLC